MRELYSKNIDRGECSVKGDGATDVGVLMGEGGLFASPAFGIAREEWETGGKGGDGVWV